MQARTSSVPATLWQTYSHLVSGQTGHRALFRGWTPAVLRGFPANAALFTGVELTSRLCEEWGLF